MQHELYAMRKMLPKLLFWGLLFTALDVFLFVSGWWTDFLRFWVLFFIGPLLLIGPLLSLIFIRFNSPHLPEGWENLSREEFQDLGIKRAIEASLQGNKGAKLTLWMMCLMNPTYRQRIDTFLAEREK